MARINRAFQWAYLAVALFAAGARAAPGARGEMIEMLCACLMLFGFLAWAFVAYCYAWALAIGDIRARMRRNRAVVVHVTYGRVAPPRS